MENHDPNDPAAVNRPRSRIAPTSAPPTPYFLNQYSKIPYPTPAGSVVRAL
jgi:hypothetical protein